MQLVVHAPFGSRINRAWGLALRKRFCRKFNFELQAAATEDAIVLSLVDRATASRSRRCARYLHSKTVRDVLVQALLDAPMFGARWRWNATARSRCRASAAARKVPPQLQRMEAEDLLAAVFPDQLACAREHRRATARSPTTRSCAQTIDDCLHEAMDVDGLERVLAAHRARRDPGGRARRSPSRRRSRTRS